MCFNQPTNSATLLTKTLENYSRVVHQWKSHLLEIFYGWEIHHPRPPPPQPNPEKNSCPLPHLWRSFFPPASIGQILQLKPLLEKLRYGSLKKRIIKKARLKLIVFIHLRSLLTLFGPWKSLLSWKDADTGQKALGKLGPRQLGPEQMGPRAQLSKALFVTF